MTILLYNLRTNFEYLRLNYWLLEMGFIKPTGGLKLKLFISLILTSSIMIELSYAQSIDDRFESMQKQIEDLEEKVSEQEKTNSQLLQQIRQEESQKETHLKLNASNIKQMPPDKSTEDLKFSTKYPFTLKGFLKADGFFSDGSVNSTDAPRFATGKNDDDTDFTDTFTGTVQHSRLIGKWDGPENGEVDVSGYLEMDLFNLGDIPDSLKFNNNELRVRQLYMDLGHDSWSVRAGQAWDLFSPLNPKSLNTNGNLWFGGNAGFRRPQLRLTKWFDFNSTQRLVVAASLNANLGLTRVNGQTFKSGEDSGIPVVEGSLSYQVPLSDAGNAKVGLSGLWGEEEVDSFNSDKNQWAIGADAQLPLTEILSVKGEIHHGENTDAFLAGGGINTNGDEIETTSGWAQLSLKLTEMISLNVLYGIDTMSSGDLINGDREENQIIGTNILLSWSKAVTIGFEYDYFDTDYKNMSSENADLFWGSMIFNF